jgi:hypothetical protein
MNDAERRRLGWIYACHVVLALLMTLWRMLESTPGIASASGGTFSATPFGRALALGSILAGVVALIAVVILSLRSWRNWRVLVLLVALAGALAFRKGIDVFDIAYLMLVAIFATLGLARHRDASRSP